MQYLVYAQLLILTLALIPHWYRLIKEVYQDLKHIHQARKRHYYRRHRRRWWQVVLWRWK